MVSKTSKLRKAKILSSFPAYIPQQYEEASETFLLHHFLITETSVLSGAHSHLN